jgi:lipopolysaccharide/colanic/teichoic acid biosynthesis glycosyltransferase
MNIDEVPQFLNVLMGRHEHRRAAPRAPSYYLRNWSLTFDLQIIVMTALHACNSKKAY